MRVFPVPFPPIRTTLDIVRASSIRLSWVGVQAHHLCMFSADPALLIKSRAASNIFCLIGALAEQATKAKYLKMILKSSIVFAFEISGVLDSFVCLTNASNLLVSWVKSAKDD